MSNKYVWISVLAVLLAFAGGFLLANALNRSQIDDLLRENGRLKGSGSSPQQARQPTLTDEEIKTKIAEADSNPRDFVFQKGLGLALYRYAAGKQDKALLAEVARLLERAHSLNPDDYQVLVSLGNVQFDLGQLNKDEKSNNRAREIYEKALLKNPKDPDVLADLGLTYLLTGSKDLKRSISELKKALEQNPKHERALQYLTQAQIEDNNPEEAGKNLAKLKEVYPKNPGIPELESKISGID